MRRLFQAHADNPLVQYWRDNSGSSGRVSVRKNQQLRLQRTDPLQIRPLLVVHSYLFVINNRTIQ